MLEIQNKPTTENLQRMADRIDAGYADDLRKTLSTKVAARIEGEIFNKVHPPVGLAALVSHKKPGIADTPSKVDAVNALGLAAPIQLGDCTPYWPIDKGYAKHA